MSADTAILHPVLRAITVADLDRVMEIEESAYPFPWTRGIFEDCLRVGYECCGLQWGPLLVGYAVHTQFAAECHLLNLCIDPAWQRRGFGSLLLEQTVHRARSENCSSIFLEVRPSNRAGIALYRKRGFYVVGERPDYYRARYGRESAIIMRLDLDELPAADVPARVRQDPF